MKEDRLGFSGGRKRPFLPLTFLVPVSTPSPRIPVVTSLLPDKCLRFESSPNTHVMTTYTLLITCLFPEIHLRSSVLTCIMGDGGRDKKSDLVHSTCPNAEDLSKEHNGFYPVSSFTTLAMHQGTQSGIHFQFLSVPHTLDPQRRQVRT